MQGEASAWTASPNAPDIAKAPAAAILAILIAEVEAVVRRDPVMVRAVLSGQGGGTGWEQVGQLFPHYEVI